MASNLSKVGKPDFINCIFTFLEVRTVDNISVNTFFAVQMYPSTDRYVKDNFLIKILKICI